MGITVELLKMNPRNAIFSAFSAKYLRSDDFTVPIRVWSTTRTLRLVLAKYEFRGLKGSQDQILADSPRMTL